MCGIAGVVGNIDPARAEQLVRSMTASVARRGPDAEGLHSWPGAVLGHRRLSIFDLSPAGHQPMVSPDGAVGVVFNGAIYNFLELRGLLTAAGYSFRSRTDTERCNSRSPPKKFSQPESTTRKVERPASCAECSIRRSWSRLRAWRHTFVPAELGKSLWYLASSD